MDISNITAEPIAHEVKHPKTGDNVGIRVTLLPISDPAIKKIQRQIQDRKNYLAARGKILTAEEMEAFSIQLVTTAATGWDWYGDATFHDEKPAFSRENLKRVCTELDWFLTDLDQALGDTKSFF